MNDEEKVLLANEEPMTTIIGKRSGQEYKVRNFTYGVLVPDSSHPLSCVSVSNTSISIDLWKGCAWKCAYCHVQGTLQDIGKEGRMPIKPEPRSNFSIDEIIDALIVHPFFTAHQSVISIGTASTEPFASGEVLNSTFQIMQAFIKRNLRNPFWIITKAGIPDSVIEELKQIVLSGNQIMISICWASNPKNIEPASANRFRNIIKAKSVGVKIAWYMRPIVAEWSGNLPKIETMIKEIANKYGSAIDAIVPGGLRWTEGIEYGLKEIFDQPMPRLTRDDNIKVLSDEIWNGIFDFCKKYFPDTPVFRNSSCQISYFLNLPSINLVQDINPNSCHSSVCDNNQRLLCEKRSVSNIDIKTLQKCLDKLALKLKIVEFNPDNGIFVTIPPLSNFSYAIQQTVIKTIAMCCLNDNKKEIK